MRRNQGGPACIRSSAATSLLGNLLGRERAGPSRSRRGSDQALVKDGQSLGDGLAGRPRGLFFPGCHRPKVFDGLAQGRQQRLCLFLQAPRGLLVWSLSSWRRAVNSSTRSIRPKGRLGWWLRVQLHGRGGRGGLCTGGGQPLVEAGQDRFDLAGTTHAESAHEAQNGKRVTRRFSGGRAVLPRWLRETALWDLGIKSLASSRLTGSRAAAS